MSTVWETRLYEMNRIPYKKRGPKIVVKVIYVSYKDGNKNFNAKKKKVNILCHSKFYISVK